MTDLTDFLLARIAEDERMAQVSHGVGDGDHELRRAWPEGLLVGRGRVLAECVTKRRIVELAKGSIHRLADAAAEEWGIPHEDTYADEMLLRFLALPYADHPAYRSEWRT